MPNLRSIYKTDRVDELPAERQCNRCRGTKPREQMIVQHRTDPKGNYYYFRPFCKECNNTRERGHRREYKTKYLRRWRRENKALTRSYWDNPQAREQNTSNAADYVRRNKDAIAIQRRLRKRGHLITMAEARDLLDKFGRCYPTKYGLTIRGQKACERMRSRLRSRQVDRRRRQSPFEIRMMVYEEGLEKGSGYLVAPDQQPEPYQYARENLRQWHRNQRIIAGEIADRPPAQMPMRAPKNGKAVAAT